MAPEATFTYDGRSYLTAATDPGAGTSVTPLYSSEGLLLALEEHTGPTLDRRHRIFYFAGSPVAQWTTTAGTETWHHYTTDHLGTPIIATDTGGTELWRSRLDSFGADPDRDTVAGALFDNEDGFSCSARTRRNPCQTCEQCCQSNLDSGRQLKRVFAKTVLETVPPPRTPLYGWP